jgi:DNA repair exonuclease SbcCD ATPase subunit
VKNIILKELTLSNFKGQNRHVVFGEHENYVSGENASGKSTLYKAFFWLLSGYCDAQTVPNADLFDNKQEITPDTPIASVTAVISIDGENYTVCRSAKAKFTRERGTDTYKKASSDEYSYSIDNIERNASDFKAWLNENIAPEDLIKFVLSGEFFITQVFDDKKKSRQIIEKLVGTVSREEMTVDYTDIDELLKKYTPEEIEMQAANLSKGINQRLNEIPSLIKSKENEIAEIEQTDFEGNEKEIAKLEEERTDLDKRMTDLSERVRPQMDAKYKAERDKQMKQDVYDKAYYDWCGSIDTRHQKLLDEINAIRQQNEKSQQAHDKALRDIENAKTQKQFKTRELEVANNKRAALLKERDEEKARVFDTSAAVCPYCGHQLDGDKLQEEVNKFEAKRRQAVDEIVAQGKANNEVISRLNEEIKRLDAVINTPAPEVISQSVDELVKQANQIASVVTSKEEFNKTEAAKTLLADIEAVVIPEVVMPDNSEIVAAKKEVNDKLTPLYERRGLKSRLQSLKEGIEVLRTEQKEKGSELAKYERQRQLVKNYKQEQMEILGHKVNDGLKFSRIECWSQQKDGQIVPDLVIKDAKGVNFATTNGASRGLTVVDIQRFFCDKLGINMPTFLDEASIYNMENLPKLENVQMFYLFCSDGSLKIESK